mgnify:CR=1 FL=1
MVNRINNLYKNSFLSLYLNAFNVFINFLLIFVIANFLGPSQFGKYIFLISLIKIFGLPGMVGYPYFILKKASSIKSNKKNRFNSLLNINCYFLLIYLFLLILLLFLLKLFFPIFLSQDFYLIVFGFLIIIPVLSINSSISSIIRSSNGEIKSQIFDTTILNIIFLLLIFLYNLKYQIQNYKIYFFIYCLACILTLINSIYKSKNLLDLSFLNVKFFNSNLIIEIQESIYFILIQIFMALNDLMPIIILGLFNTPVILGKYKIAIQISSTIGISLRAINKIIQPRVVKSFWENDFNTIQNIAIKSNKVVSIYSFIISVLIFIFYKYFINYFFGSEYSISNLNIFIIILTPFINSIFGSVGSILNMSGYEKVSFIWCLSSFFIAVVFSFILIPFMGLNGAALSTLISTFIWNFVLWKKSSSLLNVKTSYFLNSVFKF